MKTPIESHGSSHVGHVRSRNEDCFDIAPEAGLFLVADGMGGHGNGDIASRIAVAAARDAFVKAKSDAEGTLAVAERLQQAFSEAHEQIRQAGDKDRALRGMGTTLIGVVVDNMSAVVGHVGDSRVYALRGRTLTQLTEDHSWVHEQVVAGHMSEDQARDHPFKSVVTRALGGDQHVEVDLRRVQLLNDDLLILCSDGLTTMLTDAEITETLLAGGSLKERCDRLVEQANERGGVDNITVVLLAMPPESDSAASAGS